jgi:EamA domain-containing membrane protein RarD
MIAWTLFHNPMPLRSDVLLWLLLPLCASVAVVYKAIRTHELRRLPLEMLALLGYMAAGLVVLGTILWLIQAYWP